MRQKVPKGQIIRCGLDYGLRGSHAVRDNAPSDSWPPRVSAPRQACLIHDDHDGEAEKPKRLHAFFTDMQVQKYITKGQEA